MSLIYITGVSGTGKSAVKDELKKREYEAYDIDEEGMAHFYNIETGEKVKKPAKIEDRTSAWYEKHRYNISRQKVEKLAKQAENKTIFLCGTVSNENEVWDLFSKVIFLNVDETTLRHRIATRTSHDFGKAESELKNILSWHKDSLKNYTNFGAIVVDVNQPINKIVEEILEIASDNKS